MKRLVRGLACGLCWVWLFTVFVLTMPVLVPHAMADSAPSIRLATTTSTYNSGLIDFLLQAFQQVSAIEVQVIAVGTGKALQLGKNGDVDVVLTHAPKAEAEFVAAGYGVDPRQIMYNDFIIVGPPDDPAQLGSLSDVAQGIEAIFNAQARFVSRGDDSGTHKKEQQLWQVVGQQPQYVNYLESGRGMGHTLQMASELQAYTLTDRGTWLALQEQLYLNVVLQSDPRLLNPYQVILVNPAQHPHVKNKHAKAFVNWLVSDAGQQVIGAFTIHGETLFVPSANMSHMTIAKEL